MNSTLKRNATVFVRDNRRKKLKALSTLENSKPTWHTKYLGTTPGCLIVFAIILVDIACFVAFGAI